MSVNRRQLIAGAAGTGATLALATARAEDSASMGAAGAAAPAPSPAQAPGYQRFRAGAAVVTALSDGFVQLGPPVLPNVDPEAFAQAMHRAFQPDGSAYTASVNAFLVEGGGRTILIDAGAGSAMGPTVGNLPDSLAAAGVRADEIDAVLLTHMHADHVGGLIDGDGNAAFARAELVIREAEIDYWTAPSTREALPPQAQGTVDGARAVAAAYEARIRRFADDGSVAEGIEAVALYGHTPGHTGYRIGGPDEADALLVWGDVMHVPPVQMPHPEIYLAFDTSPQDAVNTRVSLLERAAARRLRIAGMHMPFPAVGHVVAASGRYRFVPAGWQHTL